MTLTTTISFSPSIRTLRAVVSAAVVINLSACATVNVSDRFALRGNQREGLAVVSLSSEGLGLHDAPIWKYRRLDGTGSAQLATNGLSDSLDWQSPPGRLAYFALPPGEYEFYESVVIGSSGGGGMTWSMGPGGVATNSNPNYAGFNQPSSSSIKADPYSVKFTIKAGELTYIGNLHLYGRPIAQRAFVMVHDQRDRDLKLLFQKLPGVLER